MSSNQQTEELQLKCDPVARLVCYASNAAHENDCGSCVDGVLTISIQNDWQKRDVCNRLKSFGISSLVDLNGSCGAGAHQEQP